MYEHVLMLFFKRQVNCIFFGKQNKTKIQKPTLFLMLPKWMRQLPAGPSSLERHVKRRYNTSVTEKMKSLPEKALERALGG